MHHSSYHALLVWFLMHLVRPLLALDRLLYSFQMMPCIWLAGTDSDFVVKLIDVYVPAPSPESFNSS